MFVGVFFCLSSFLLRSAETCSSSCFFPRPSDKIAWHVDVEDFFGILCHGSTPAQGKGKKENTLSTSLLHYWGCVAAAAPLPSIRFAVPARLGPSAPNMSNQA
ncbi:hypothetical protein K438DRAFT_1820824 [Mycena galopus ATCC 62051]|nr:hypothetical protein K438DRAFT_1820824 [Mycena galopus ATCC 62051]